MIRRVKVTGKVSRCMDSQPSPHSSRGFAAKTFLLLSTCKCSLHPNSDLYILDQGKKHETAHLPFSYSTQILCIIINIILKVRLNRDGHIS